MTRKSYKLIAESIGAQVSKSHEEREFDPQYHIRELTDNLATILKLDNPRFDRDKFLNACGF